MTEPRHPSGDRPAYPPPTAPPPPRGGRPLAWLFTLLLLAGVGYGAWQGWQWLAGRVVVGGPSQAELIARLEQDVAALRAQQAQIAATVQRADSGVAALGSRVEENQQATARLAETVEGGRTQVQLAAVEQLLLLAGDRLQLAHDGAGALRALDLADRRLAQLNDPRVYKVREALAEERAAVAQLALPDVTGATLSLSQLLKRAPELPLRVRVPERFEAQGADVVPSPEASWGDRVWAAVKTALANVFALRRNDGPKERLLAPDQQALVGQILALKLEGARLALLASDTRTFQELAAASADWLRAYYDEGDPAVKVALAELDRLASLNLAPSVPELGRSLAQLRALMR